MTVELTGHGLTLDAVVRVARASERVELSTGAVAAHARASRRRRARVTGGHTDIRRDHGRRDASRRRRERERRDGVQPLRDLRSPRRARSAGCRRGSCAQRSSVMRTLSPPATRAPDPRSRERTSTRLNDSNTAAGQLARHGRAVRPRPERRPRARRARANSTLEAGEALALLNGNAFSTGQGALAVVDAGAARCAGSTRQLRSTSRRSAATSARCIRRSRSRGARTASARRSRGSTRCSTGARSGSPERLASSRIR